MGSDGRMIEVLKVGDIVQLKSGGPKMTVSAVDDNPRQMADDDLQLFQDAGLPLPPPVIWCVWFDGTKKMSGDFALAMLEKIG
jgi:uncharacterized protein YodC (DUF2158 family)